MASEQVRQSGESQLTRAEREVLAVLLTGAHNRQIAEQLFVTEATIRTHLTHIYAKLEVDGRAALIATFRDDVSLRSSMPAPIKPRRAIRPWVFFGVAATMLVWFVATFASTEHGVRTPLWAPTSAAGARVAVGSDVAATPAVRRLDGQAAPADPAEADAAPLALFPSATASTAAVLIVLGGCALALAIGFRRFRPTHLVRLRPRPTAHRTNR